MTIASGTSIRLSLATLSALTIVGMVVAPAEAETWKAYSYNPSAAAPPVAGLNRMAEQIEEATAGKIRMNVNVGGSMPISSTDITQAVGDNIVQVGADGFFLGNIRIGGVLRLPVLLTSRDEYDRAAEIMEPYIEEALAEQGVTLLAQYVYPLQVVWSSKELRSLDDISGQKMRVTSPEQGEFVERFGGVPVTIGAPEVSTSLQRGVVDGVFTASSGGGRIWKDLLKSNYRFGPNYFNSLIIINSDVFERLSEEEQQAVESAAEEAAAWITATLTEEEAEITQQLADEGMIVTEPKQEDVVRAVTMMEDYWPQWAADVGPEAEEALAKVREAVGH